MPAQTDRDEIIANMLRVDNKTQGGGMSVVGEGESPGDDHNMLDSTSPSKCEASTALPRTRTERSFFSNEASVKPH